MINIIIIILIILIIVCNNLIKKNIEKFEAGQSMFVNIDSKKLYNNKKLRDEWKKEITIPDNKIKYKTCNEYNDYVFFNQPEKTLNDYKIEFDDSTENTKKTIKSFEIPCNNFKKKKDLSSFENKINKKKLFLNNIDYRTAEKYYKENYGYNIIPLNIDEWYLPSNYTDFSQYNRPTLDKKIVDDAIPPRDKYKTRAFNWHFGKL